MWDREIGFTYVNSFGSICISEIISLLQEKFKYVFANW